MGSSLRLASLLFVAFLAACGSTGNDGDDKAGDCDARVAQARECLDTYCASASNQLCTCARDGKDMNASCSCTGSVDASLKSVCGTSGFSCETFRASLEAVASRGMCDACTVDDDCWDPDTSRICSAGTCVEGCFEDKDCFKGTSGRICVSQSCIDGCREDIECYESDRSRVCRANACVDGCRKDSDCYVPGGPSRICYGDTECRDGCREDIDCPSGQMCLGLVCR